MLTLTHGMTAIGHDSLRRLRIAAASLYSLGRVGPGVRMNMGAIAILLYAPEGIGGQLQAPPWVVRGRRAAMALGTLASGGGMVQIVGLKITPQSPWHGFSADERPG